MRQKKYSLEHFIKLAEDKGGKCLSTEYANGRVKMQFQCKCGFQWFAEPRHIIEGRWCPKCGKQTTRLYTADDAFFSRDNEESFYVAGFYAADGWKTRKSGGSFTVGLSLAAKDLEHVQLIHKTLGCTSPIKYRIRKYKNPKRKTTFSYTFIINSEQMYNDLTRFNIVENKTYIYDMPDWLKIHPLVRHFIRGYIDGDGCFCKAKNKDQFQHITFSMKGTANCLNSVLSIFINEGIVTTEETRRKLIPKNGKKRPAFDNLQCGGNAVISRMHDYLYKDSNIYLTRKKNKSGEAKDLMIYGTDKKKKKHRDSLPITKEILLQLGEELKTVTKIAEHFGCTKSNISWLTKQFGIRKEMAAFSGKLDNEKVIEKYKELNKAVKVALFFNVSTARICQIIKKAKVNQLL